MTIANRRQRPPGRTRLIWFVAFVLVAHGGFGLSVETTSAQDPGFVSREPKIKAAFLYKFVNYIRWPNAVFADASSPIVIGVLGNDPVNKYLYAITRTRKAGTRPLKFVQVKAPHTAVDCHILFVGDAANQGQVQATLAELDGKPVLTVGERDDFLGAGGGIEFAVAENRVKIRLALKNVERSGLRLSAKIMSVVEVVR